MEPCDKKAYFEQLYPELWPRVSSQHQKQIKDLFGWACQLTYSSLRYARTMFSKTIVELDIGDSKQQNQLHLDTSQEQNAIIDLWNNSLPLKGTFSDGDGASELSDSNDEFHERSMTAIGQKIQS